MAGIKLEGFMGLVPRSSNRLLPPMAATEATNTKLLNGEIRGFRSLREEADFSSGAVNPVRKAFRVVDNAGVNPDAWLVFDSRDVDVVRSPIVNDTFDRYYWAGDGQPQMNEYDNIYSGTPSAGGSPGPWLLGVPQPTSDPTITPPSGDGETRAYVYTFYSPYNEEGPPSEPIVGTGDAGTWTVGNIQTTIPDAASRPSGWKIRIYRTVSGGTSSNFYYVGEQNIGSATYVDTVDSTTVAANNLLESTTWFPPPTDLEGMVAMPNGYLVGWVGRRLVFSYPYRPHAWPPEYELATEFPIVGLVVWGSTLVIGTKSQPYFGQGITPLSFTMQKLDAVEPCLSRQGMVATTAGAMYPSINGLVLANSSGAKIISHDVITKEEWATYLPENLFAAQLGLQYIAFSSSSSGLVFRPTEANSKFVEIGGFANVDGIETDRYSGNVLILHNQRAWDWDVENSERLNWEWQSKLYQTPEPVNFGAFRLNFNTDVEDVSSDVTGYYGAYNTAFFSAVPSAAGDTNWANVVLLMDWAGADAGTDTTDLSASAHTETFLGNAQLDTDRQVIGENTLLLDGTGDYVRFADSADWDFGTGDFTVECHVYCDTVRSQYIVSQRDVTNGWWIDMTGTQLRFAHGGSVIKGESWVPTVSTWYHVAVCRSGTNLRMFVDGVELDTPTTDSTNLAGSGDFLAIGANSDGGNPFHGSIGPVRITKGVARYTANFTAPTDMYLLELTNARERGMNTLNGRPLGGKPAQADGLVPSWTEPENRQPLGGSLQYPITFMSFQTSAIRVQVKSGASGEIRYDRVIYNEDIYRLPTGYKSDLWQFNFTGNTDMYSFQIATTPRSLKAV